MDTSKEYIKMCEKAVEIQKLLDKGLPYNVVFCPHCDDIRYVQWDSFCWREKYGNGDKLQEWTSDYDTSDHPHYHGNKAIWLPCQDQLQEMVKKLHPKYTSIDWVWTISQWGQNYVNEDYYKKLNLMSMEQLWLAFVMKQKYNKVWDGKNWITR